MGKKHPIYYSYPQKIANDNIFNFCPLWNADFAYCVGIITADGNLSSNGKNITVVSKDIEIVTNCQSALKPGAKIGKKGRGGFTEKKYYYLQFSDVKLYRFLNGIGLTPAKSKTIQFVSVPDQYFRDFLRGLFDGDGSISIFRNKVSKQPQVKLRFASASKPFLLWLLDKIRHLIGCEGGYIVQSLKCNSLNFGKADSGKIINFMYYDEVRMYLNRKKITCGRVVKR
jgi:hypothetical protein